MPSAPSRQRPPHPPPCPRAGLLAACAVVPLVAPGTALTAALVIAPVLLRAQATAPPTAARGTLTGAAFGAASGQPVASAAVTVRRAAGDTALAGGARAGADGAFRVEGLRPGRYTVRVRALGFAPLVRAVTVPEAGGVVALGRFALADAAVRLGGVRVEGEQAQATLAPDRNTYQTKDLPAAAGGTAVDVLRNVPQVEVDADNNISLRGNPNVTVQINGRATPLKGQQLANYLAQLPATLVAKVDVVTNPSAKQDPDGAGGIINITLTQRTDLGTSGGLQLATSTTALANLSGNVGRQQGRWTTFASYGFYYNAPRPTGSTERLDPSEPLAAALSSTLTGRQRPLFHSATLRGEYKPAAHDALTADAVFNTGGFTRSTDALYTAADAAGTTTARFAQLTDLRYTQTTGDYTLGWRHTVDPQRNALSVELRYNDARTGIRNDLASRPFLLTDSSALGALALPTRDQNRLAAGTWRAQADWTRALGGTLKLEAGVLGIRRRAPSETASLADSGAALGYVADPALAFAFRYRENVASVYGVLSGRSGRFDFQGGLRLERAGLGFDLVPADPAAAPRSYDNGYRSAFPSALVAYDLDAQRQVKLSYARRISRPDPGQLNPFVQRQDAFETFQGNPALRPEYTNALEAGYQHGFARGSFQLSPYFRRTPGAVRLVRTVDTAGVVRATFANVERNDQYGTDVNLTLRLGRFTGFGGGSVFYTATEAHNITPDVSFRGAGWSARGNATYKLTPSLDVQALASYRAPRRVEGGRLESFAMTTFALRQKIRGEQQSVTLRLQDPFNTMAFRQKSTTNGVLQVTDRHFGQRSVGVSYSYQFGKPAQLRPPNPEGAPPSGGGPPG